ncbi:uncharacterized protein LOC115891218 [Sitophilus oryzae]|uniref:Uncharacterized protein LOC115891218 n=1 Tax=Sitophilus oryzae TaxID=7048 RepID=A0A6J2YTS6_SITOR|nr:uncharacterized protein LOC115891218 [Sitophilus oryzae]
MEGIITRSKSKERRAMDGDNENVDDGIQQAGISETVGDAEATVKGTTSASRARNQASRVTSQAVSEVSKTKDFRIAKRRQDTKISRQDIEKAESLWIRKIQTDSFQKETFCGLRALSSMEGIITRSKSKERRAMDGDNENVDDGY